MSDRTAYFSALSNVTLDEDYDGDGNRQVWSPNGWHIEGGVVRMPVQHEDEDGADCDVSFTIDHEGKTKFTHR